MTLCETVDQFLGEIVEEHLAELRASDEEYREVNHELIIKSEQVKKELDSLSNAQRRLFVEYSDTRNQQEAMNNSFLYKNGLLDAVRLLRILGVL